MLFFVKRKVEVKKQLSCKAYIINSFQSMKIPYLSVKQLRLLYHLMNHHLLFLLLLVLKFFDWLLPFAKKSAGI